MQPMKVAAITTCLQTARRRVARQSRMRDQRCNAAIEARHPRAERLRIPPYRFVARCVSESGDGLGERARRIAELRDRETEVAAGDPVGRRLLDRSEILIVRSGEIAVPHARILDSSARSGATAQTSSSIAVATFGTRLRT